MTVPVLETGWTTHSSVSDDATVSLGKPTGLVAGDTILVIAASEQSNNNYMPNITSPDVYERISHGNNRADVQLGIYLREATGTETWPLVFECSNLDFYTNVAVCIRITGACTTGPHRVGAWAGQGATGTSLTIPEVTTAVNDCLGVWVGATDGSDVSPFSITSGTGWSRTGGLENPTNDSNGIGLDFGEKDHTTAGVSVDLVLDMAGTTADGRVGIQLMFAPDTEFTDTPHSDPTEVISFLDETPGASSQATGSGSYVAGDAYVAIVTSFVASGSVAATLAGWSNTWTDVSDTLGQTTSLWNTATDRRVQVFEIQGQCVGSGSGALTVSYSTAPSSIAVQVIRIPNGGDIVAMDDATGTLGTVTDYPYGWNWSDGIDALADPGSRTIAVFSGNANRASTVTPADETAQLTGANDPKVGSATTGGTALGWGTSPTGYSLVTWSDVSGAFSPSPGANNDTGGSSASYRLVIEVGVAAPPPAITGTGASTLADVTSAGTGAYTPAPISGTGASTLDDATSAGSGTSAVPVFTGTGASTLDDVTSAGTGAYTPPDISGTGASTLADVTSAGVGAYTPPGITGTGASTLADVTSAGTGTFLVGPITGTGASTLGDVTSHGVGTGTSPPQPDPNITSPFRYRVRQHMVDLLPQGATKAGAGEQHDRELEDYLAWMYSKVAFRSGQYGPTLVNMVIGSGGNPVNVADWTVSNDQLLIAGKVLFGTSGATYPTGVVTLSLPDDYTFDDAVPDDVAVGQATHSDAGVLTDSTIRRESATTVRVVIPAGMTYAAGDSITYQYTVRIPLIWTRT